MVAVNSLDLPTIGAAVREIAEMEQKATAAVSQDAFSAQLLGRHCEEQMTAEDRAVLRRLCLRTLFRRISLQAQRCANLGVSIRGYEDMDSWVETKIAELLT